VEVPTDIGDLDQSPGSEFGEENRGVRRGATMVAAPAGWARAPGLHNAGAYGALQAQLFALKGNYWRTEGPRLLSAAGDVTHGRQIGLKFPVICRPYRGHGQSRGPPALTPLKQQARSAGAQGTTLRQFREFGTLRRSLGTEL
jgi:hypothetical protein